MTTRTAAHNSTYPKVAVQWLNEALCFVSSSVLADSFVFRNHQLLIAAKRYMKTFNLISLIFIVLTLQAQTDLQDEFIVEWETKYSKKNEFKGYKLYMPTNQAYILGDFFGDEVKDYAFFIVDSSNKVKLAFIDKGESEKFRVLGLKDDPFDIDDYRWAEIFKKVEKGDVLWSNYTDDFRKLSEVPEIEKVIVNYDALYLHAAESCGGGFVFWKDGKFNWLQQE